MRTAQAAAVRERAAESAKHENELSTIWLKLQFINATIQLPLFHLFLKLST